MNDNKKLSKDTFNLQATTYDIDKNGAHARTLYPHIIDKLSDTEPRSPSSKSAKVDNGLRRQPPEGFEKESFWKTLCDFQTTRDMVTYLEKTAGEYPNVLNEDILKKAKNCVQLERIYGRGVGIQEVQNIVKAHMGL